MILERYCGKCRPDGVPISGLSCRFCSEPATKVVILDYSVSGACAEHLDLVQGRMWGGATEDPGGRCVDCGAPADVFPSAELFPGGITSSEIDGMRQDVQRIRNRLRYVESGRELLAPLNAFLKKLDVVYDD